MHPGERALEELIQGNARFAAGNSVHRDMGAEELAELAKAQRPIAAVVACSDSRVAPELIFDQPLGSIFVARIPGNVAGDSVKWMLDLAIMDFSVPLLAVVGHSGCLALGQVLNGQITGPGGSLRLNMLSAVRRAQARGGDDVWRDAVAENALQTIVDLERGSDAFRQALGSKSIVARAMVYDMVTGRVELL